MHSSLAAVAVLLVASLAAAPSAAGAEPRRPNVVVIMMDDLGYGDLASYGAPDIRTPGLDRLAREGVRLTSYYTSGSSCTPTRAALMTGRYQQRVGLETAIPAIDHRAGLPVSEISLARMLKAAGYRTALAGKWHLGLDLEFGPNAHGFDTFFGFRAGHLDYFSHRTFFGTPDLWENTARVERPGYLTDLITSRAVAAIEDPGSAPLFLFVSYNAPHDPWQDPDHPEDVRSRDPWDHTDKAQFARRLEKWSEGSRAIYARMVERADAGIGKILDALERRGLARDTLVVFSSDNGGERFSRNRPLFHHKGSLWEGGIHVPCLLRWPGKLPAGRVSEQPVITMDLTATILAAAGAAPPAGRRLDGIDVLPILARTRPPLERTFFWRAQRTERPQRAVRKGNWKYLEDGAEAPILFLFDLEHDAGERRNLWYERPALAGELRGLLDRWQAEVTPAAGPGAGRR